MMIMVMLMVMLIMAKMMVMVIVQVFETMAKKGLESLKAEEKAKADALKKGGCCCTIC